MADIADVTSGQSPPGSSYNQDGIGMEFHQGKKHFGDSSLNASGVWTTEVTRKALPGDIVMSVRAPVGPINYVDREVCIGRGLASIRPNEAIKRGFLAKFLLMNEGRINGHAGATFNSINKKEIEGIHMPLPPLEEQERIVEVLDEAFAAIDKAKANIERNLTNARELFQSRLNDIFSNPSEGWNEVRLPEVVSESCSLSYGIVQPGSDKPQGLPIVRPKDMRVKFIGAEGLKKVNPSVAESYQRTSLQGGELLLCVRGETGLVSIASKELNGANVTRGIVPVGFDDSIVDLEFGYYQFLSPPLKRQVKDKTYGSTLQQINIRDVKTLSLSLPPLSTQRGIADDMQKLDLFTDSLTAHYIKELDNLEELRQSILEQAFEGKLTEPVAA